MPTGASSDPARRAGLLLFLLLATAVGITATFGLAALRDRLERSRMAQTAITEIRLDTTGLAALKLMSSQQPAVRRAMGPYSASTEMDLYVNLDRFGRLIDDDDVTTGVRQAVTRFVDEVQRSSGSLSDPSSPLSSLPYLAWFNLDNALTKADELAEHRAASARRDATLGTWVIMLMAGGFISLLAGRFAAERSRSRQLATYASTDALSGLCNRGGFDVRLDEHIARARQSRSNLSLVVLDIDHFKGVNDTHGHTVGDDVIIEVARRLGAKARSNDVLARLGGDEYAWLMPGVGSDDAREAADRALHELCAVPFATAGTVTASVGVASLGEHDMSREDLMRRADEALYAAKRAGRARVAAAPLRGALA